MVFFCAVICGFLSGFDVAAVAGMLGFIKSPFIISLSWYTPSLLLAYSFLCMIISLYYDDISDKSIYSFFSIVLAIIYATLNSFVYIIQVLIIAPSFVSGNFAGLSLFEIAEGKPFWAVNGLAYTLMGFSTLFASFSVNGTGIRKWIKYLLFIHGIVAPAILGAVVAKPFFILSSTVGITYPVLAVVISIYMWKSRKG